MIIDFHCHLGKDSKGESLDVDEMLHELEKNKVDKIVVFPFNGDDQKLIDDSLRLLELAKENSKMIPFLRFNPKTITKSELEKLLQLNFKGIKLHPKAQQFDPCNLEIQWVFERINTYGLPILFHCKAIQPETSHPLKIVKLAKKYTNINFIIGHFFGDYFAMIPDICSLPNVYTETSVYSRTKRITDIVLKNKFDRIMFGSDIPYDDQESILMKIRKANLPQEELDKILFKNAIKVLKL